MHNKASAPVVIDQRNRPMKKSRSASNLPVVSKKKLHAGSPAKIEVDAENKFEARNLSPSMNRITSSPNHRRRQKRASVNSNSLLSTVASVHELMSFVIHKDHPPTWLAQTDLFQEYTSKSQQISADNLAMISPHQYYQQVHRKQRCNLQMYARSGDSWQPLPSPPLVSPTNTSRSTARMHRLLDHHGSPEKIAREPDLSPVVAARLDLITPLNVSVKQESTEENALLIPAKPKSIRHTPARRQQMLCKKKISQNGLRRREQMNSVENLESYDKKDLSSSSSSSSSSQHDSSTSSSSSSIEHASPSPTTTASCSSSRRSSPPEYMRGHRSMNNARLSSPLRIQTSMSPHAQSMSTPQRRSTRTSTPSNFYIDPVWIVPTVVSAKRSLEESFALCPSSPPPPAEPNQRPRRLCRT